MQDLANIKQLILSFNSISTNTANTANTTNKLVSELQQLKELMHNSMNKSSKEFKALTKALTQLLTEHNQAPNIQGITQAPFTLKAVDIWDASPQASIQIGTKTSIVDVGYIRLGWKVIAIDFDKELIKIINTETANEMLTLEMRR